MKEYTTKVVIANTIRMARAQIPSTFLIVEGDTDARLYKRFVDRDKCKVIPAHNKDNAIGALTLLEQESFPGVLSIVDADFMVLEDKLPESQHILLTDTHDVETMLIKSPALETVLSEYSSETKITTFMQSKDIRTQLIESGVLLVICAGFHYKRTYS